MATVLSYRFRQSTNVKVENAEQAATTWASDEALDDVRRKLARECGSTLVLASEHIPELWLCDENDTLLAKGDVDLLWTPTTAMNDDDARLLLDKPWARNKPKAFILFTFPQAASAQTAPPAPTAPDDVAQVPAFARLSLDERRHSLQKQRRGQYKPGEGRDRFCRVSDEKLRQLEQALWLEKHVLIRSPPSSGKTTMADCFGDYLENKGLNVFQVSCLGLCREERDSEAGLDQWWARVGLSSFTEVASKATRENPYFILADEAQMLYKNSYFWQTIKQHPGLFVCCFALYGYNPIAGEQQQGASPVDLYPFGLDFLRLSYQDAAMVTDALLAASDMGTTISINDESKQLIYHLTKGHPGVLRNTVGYIIKGEHQYRDFASQRRFLLSGSYRAQLKERRAFAWMQDLELYEAERSFLMNALRNCDAALGFFYEGAVPVRLVHNGLLFKPNSDRVEFLMPLAFDMVLSRLLHGTLELLKTSESFEEFLLTTIKRLHPQRLRQVLSSSVLLEDFWQKEFFVAALSVIRTSVTMVTNAGNGQSLPPGFAYLDFYIDGNLHWGVELVRNGNELQSHVERFQVGGKYSGMKLVHWAVVDFRNPDAPQPNRHQLKDNVWYAVCDANFSTITVIRKGRDDVVLKLLSTVSSAEYV